MIYVTFKNGEILEVKNDKNLTAELIFDVISKSTGLMRIFDFIFNMNDVLYITVD